MTKKKLPVTGGMKVRAYPVLERAVEQGFAYGWARAHKHTATPDEHAIEEQVVRAIMNEICEVFRFDEDDPE